MFEERLAPEFASAESFNELLQRGIDFMEGKISGKHPTGYLRSQMVENQPEWFAYLIELHHLGLFTTGSQDLTTCLPSTEELNGEFFSTGESISRPYVCGIVSPDLAPFIEYISVPSSLIVVVDKNKPRVLGNYQLNAVEAKQNAVGIDEDNRINGNLSRYYTAIYLDRHEDIREELRLSNPNLNLALAARICFLGVDWCTGLDTFKMNVVQFMEQLHGFASAYQRLT